MSLSFCTLMALNFTGGMALTSAPYAIAAMGPVAYMAPKRKAPLTLYDWSLVTLFLTACQRLARFFVPKCV